MKKTNKLPMEAILIAKGDQNFPTGNFATNSTALNLNDGAIGVLSMDPNSAVRTYGQYLQTGDNSTEVQAIKIVQGTPASGATQNADIWEVGNKAYVETGTIRRGNIRSVMVKKARFATLGAQLITDFPTIVDEGEYNAFLKLNSVRYRKEYGITNDNSLYASVPVTNFTTDNIDQPLDYVLQRLAIDFNNQSKMVATNTRKGNKSFVVLGVKLAGGDGTVIGNIVPTSSIPFETINGVTQVLPSSVELCQALATLIHNQDGSFTDESTIEVLDRSSAGVNATVDALVVIGLPHSLAAYYDNVEQDMVTPSLSLGGDFIAGASDPIVTVCPASEGTGHSRKWDNYNRWRNQLNVHTKQIQPQGDWFSEGKSYIDLAKSFYTSYIIEYFDTENTLTLEIGDPKKATLLFRCEPDGDFTVNVTNIVTRLNSSNTPVPFFTSDDSGTGSASAELVGDVEAVLSAWLEHARTTGTNFKVGGDAVAAGTYLS